MSPPAPRSSPRFFQSASDVVNHCVGKKRSLAPEQKKALQKQQAGELARVRDDAKKAAEAIKAKHQPAAVRVLDPIFTTDFVAAGVPELTTVKEKPVGDKVYDAPFCVRDAEC